MEGSSLHTAFPEPHGNTGQDIRTTPVPSASTDDVKARKAGRTGRSRRFRKQPGGEPSASSLWHAWRREHEGQLETVFQEHPTAYELFRQAVKSAPETLEEWQQSRVRWRPWVEWREQHPGPLHEVLADPEGWAVFCQMRAQKNNPVNVTYEEWLLLPEQQQQIRSAQWEAWRREHPGPQVLALMLAAEAPGGVDEGWQIYRSLRELKGESLPESFEEWRALPKVRGEAAVSSWALWRQNHEGRLQDVLADPEGWKLYREMLSFVPAGARSRGNRSRPGPRQLPATYEEWLQRPEQQLTLATLAWTAWREQHPGKLPAVLADPEGWTLYRELKTKSLVGAGRTTQTADDSGNLVKPKTTRRGGDKGKRNRRKGTPSTFATAAATPMTTATTTTASAALAGDDGNDDAEVKGGISTADEEHQQVGSTTAEENVDASFFPETYEDWLLWRREKNKRGAVPTGEAGDDDRLAAHKNNKKRWQRWRGEHPGLLENVLAADAEGWHLYSTWMSRNGERPFFSDFNSWLEVQVAIRAWLQWKEQHPGALAVVLRNSPEGWPLYRAYVAGQSANPAVHGNERRRQLPETLQEWLQQPAQLVQVTADAWNAWRQAHPGPLRAQLSEQTTEGQEEPCGWHLLRVLLQFYMPAADGAVESGDGRAAELAQPLELSDSLESFLLALKRSSRTAWLRWSQQQRRSNLQTRLRDPVGWALYKVMRESDEAAPEFAVNYEEWLQKRAELATVAPGGNPSSVGWSGAGDGSVSHASGRMTGNAAKRQGGPELAAVTAWNRWRRQRRGDLLHVLQKHARGWQLYCNMLAARNKPVPESFAAFKEAREQQQRQEQAEALTEWESWRQQHGGPLEEVLTDPQGAALYRRMIEANNNSNTGNDERRTASETTQEATTRWLLWREQHPGPLEVVLAEHPEAVELHCAWLAAESMASGAPTSRRRRKPRAKGGRGETSDKDAVRRWREWRAQHPGALQQVLAADLAAAGERGQTEAETAGEQRLQMSADSQLLQDAGGASTGWQLFCAHAASQGRQMPASFEEWLQQPQQIARREFGLWRAEHPGLLVDVLRDPEGWQLYVRMKRAAAAAAAEEGSESPEVVEDYNEWVAREKQQRERQNRRRNRRTKAGGEQIGAEAQLAEQAYQCGGFAGDGEGIPPSAAGCHGLDSNVFGATLGGATSAEPRVDGVVR